MSSTMLLLVPENTDVVQITPRQMQYLTTLRRLPDDVVLEVAGHELDLVDSYACLCGWALRAVMAKLQRVSIDTWSSYRMEDYEAYRDARGLDAGVPELLSEKVGGTREEWSNIFDGVICDLALPDIEFAWTIRVAEAVEATAYATV